MSLVFSPFLFSSSSSRLLTIVVIQNAFTLSLSLSIYTQNISKATTFRLFASFMREKKNALLRNTTATNYYI